VHHYTPALRAHSIRPFSLKNFDVLRRSQDAVRSKSWSRELAEEQGHRVKGKREREEGKWLSGLLRVSTYSTIEGGRLRNLTKESSMTLEIYPVVLELVDEGGDAQRRAAGASRREGRQHSGKLSAHAE
jgi:hypothetical protein